MGLQAKKEKETLLRRHHRHTNWIQTLGTLEKKKL
jgi:hypothetical protein